jgi:glutamate dehydrogenase
MSPTCCARQGEERPGVLVARLAGGVEALTRDIADLLHAEARAIAAHRGGTGRSGAPADAAERVRHLTDMDGGIGLAELAADSGSTRWR